MEERLREKDENSRKDYIPRVDVEERKCNKGVKEDTEECKENYK